MFYGPNGEVLPPGLISIEEELEEDSTLQDKPLFS